MATRNSASPRPTPPHPTLLLLDEAYNRRAWHGTNLRGSLRGLSAAQAAWRGADLGHSIAELVAHCAYWKYVARRRLLSEKRGSFPLKGSDWFLQPEPLTDAAWKQFITLLDDQHAALRAAIASLTPAQLNAPHPHSKVPTSMLLRGVALHDVYHTGQIQQIKGALKRLGIR